MEATIYDVDAAQLLFWHFAF